MSRVLLLFSLLLLVAIPRHVALGQEPPSPEKPLVPNVFTPNGDGLNDQIALESTEQMTLFIFNRGGNLVFKAEGQRVTWGGRDQRGDELTDGFYFFYIRDPAQTYGKDHGFIFLSRNKSVNPQE